MLRHNQTSFSPYLNPKLLFHLMGSLNSDSTVAAAGSSSDMERFPCDHLLDTTQPIYERFRALFSLRNLKGAGPRNALILATRDSSNLLAHEAAFALGQMQDAEAIPTLESILNDCLCTPLFATRQLRLIVLDDVDESVFLELQDL